VKLIQTGRSVGFLEKTVGFLEKTVGFLEKTVGFLEKVNFGGVIFPIFPRGGSKNNITNITNISKGRGFKNPYPLLKLIKKIHLWRCNYVNTAGRG